MNKSIFISKAKQEVIELAEFCTQKQITLHAESMIRFEPVSFQLTKPYDVIFFASIRAAKYFLDQSKDVRTKSLACIGQVTANKLFDLGLKVEFIGENSGNPEKVAQNFKEWLGTRTVLVPQSNISKRTISKVIPESQLVEVIAYQTISSCKVIPEQTTYIFTSPSNFESFLSCNKTPKGTIIAWGESTKSAILSFGIRVDLTLENSEIKELIAILQ